MPLELQCMKDPGYWFWKCNFRPFETEEWINLLLKWNINNLKVNIWFENKINGKDGIIKGYKNDRFIVLIEAKKYLLKLDNIIYNEDYLMGEQKSIFGKYTKKVKIRDVTYPTRIRFRLSTPHDSWNTVYKKQNEIIERDNDLLREMIKEYNFNVRFTPRIHYKLIDYKMFLSVELLLLELNFLEKKQKKHTDSMDINIEFDTEEEED